MGYQLFHQRKFPAVIFAAGKARDRQRRRHADLWIAYQRRDVESDTILAARGAVALFADPGELVEERPAFGAAHRPEIRIVIQKALSILIVEKGNQQPPRNRVQR